MKLLLLLLVSVTFASAMDVAPIAPPVQPPPPEMIVDPVAPPLISSEAQINPSLPITLENNNDELINQVAPMITPGDPAVDQPKSEAMEQPLIGGGMVLTMGEPHEGDGMVHTMDNMLEANGTMHLMVEPHDDDGMMHIMENMPGPDETMHTMEDMLDANGTMHTMEMHGDVHTMQHGNGTNHHNSTQGTQKDKELRKCFAKILRKMNFGHSQAKVMQKVEDLCPHTSPDQISFLVMSYDNGLNVLRRVFKNMSDADMTSFNELRDEGNKSAIRQFILQQITSLPISDVNSVKKLLRALIGGHMEEDPMIRLKMRVNNNAEFKSFKENLKARNAEAVNAFINAQLAIAGKFTDEEKVMIREMIASRLAMPPARK